MSKMDRLWLTVTLRPCCVGLVHARTAALGREGDWLVCPCSTRPIVFTAGRWRRSDAQPVTSPR
jgi:hypothetical protein